MRYLSSEFSRLGRALLLAASLAACTEEEPREPSSCDLECQDQVAVRALREVVKLAYNLTLQGNDVGEQDETTECPHGGEARVFGEASSLAAQGANELDLTYELRRCRYLRRDDDAEQSYHVTVSGALVERGTLAVQPSSTTALIFESDAVTLEGDVFDPPLPYAEVDCPLRLAQNGGQLSGSWCGREVGVDL